MQSQSPDLGQIVRPAIRRAIGPCSYRRKSGTRQPAGTRKVIRKIFRYGERLWEKRLRERGNEREREGGGRERERTDRKDRRHIGIKVAVNVAR